MRNDEEKWNKNSLQNGKNKLRNKEEHDFPTRSFLQKWLPIGALLTDHNKC